jgi:Tfp pilus assembly protein PilF
MAHEPRKRRILTQLGHSPTDPEARLHHQKQLRCVDPLISMPTAERPKAMHVRNMIFCLGTVFLLAAAFVWATYDPAMTSGESSELMEAYNSYNTLYQQGRYSEAEPYAKEALKLVTVEFGPNDPNTAALLDNLALLYQAQGHYAEAEPLYQRSLAIWEKALGPEHPDMAGSLENYAVLLRQTARADEAERMEARAKAIRAASQELAASDIVKIITTYHENKSKFKRDYLGRTLMATMFFDNVGGAAFGGGYFVGFDGINGSAGLTCSFSETPPNEVIEWDAGNSVSLTGVVYDVVLSTLYLKRCRFK